MKRVLYFLKGLGVLATLMLVCQTTSFAQFSAVGPNPTPRQANATTTSPVTTNLQLDDGSAELSIGLGGGEFVWFNHLTVPAGDFPLMVEKIDVMFAAAAQGTAVELLVFEDPDGDPTNGATFLGSFATTMQFNDDVTFSEYTLPTPIVVNNGAELYLSLIHI